MALTSMPRPSYSSHYYRFTYQNFESTPTFLHFDYMFCSSQSYRFNQVCILTKQYKLWVPSLWTFYHSLSLFLLGSNFALRFWFQITLVCFFLKRRNRYFTSFPHFPFTPEPYNIIDNNILCILVLNLLQLIEKQVFFLLVKREMGNIKLNY